MSSVLIVDDEPRMREILRRFLAPAGYEIREAPDAEAALQMLEERPSDVALTDIQMPGHDGLWLVARLRERFPAVAIVLATVVDTVPPVLSMRAGVVDYLVKPFQGERVLAAVKMGVDWHETAAAAEPRREAAVDPVGDWIKRSGRPAPTGGRE